MADDPCNRVQPCTPMEKKTKKKQHESGQRREEICSTSQAVGSQMDIGTADNFSVTGWGNRGERCSGGLVQSDDEVTPVQSSASSTLCPFATRWSQDWWAAADYETLG